MKKSNFPFVVGLGVLLVAGISVVVLISQGWLQSEADPVAARFKPDRQSVDQTLVKPPELPQALGLSQADLVSVGGVDRPKRDVNFAAANTESDVQKSVIPHRGKVPEVAKDANPEVAGLFNELSADNGDPVAAAKSVRAAVEPFDLKAYQADPAAWLGQIRPGRVFQPAQPSSEIAPIAAKSPAMTTVVQGEKVIFQVEVSPDSPVTFYTSGVGEFENRLTTQSVAADERGIAKAVYTTTPGTAEMVNVVAASPLHSGQVRFRVRVKLPD